jgi:hypothetical protein
MSDLDKALLFGYRPVGIRIILKWIWEKEKSCELHHSASEYTPSKILLMMM